MKLEIIREEEGPGKAYYMVYKDGGIVKSIPISFQSPEDTNKSYQRAMAELTLLKEGYPKRETVYAEEV